jgi:hypothetical protein
MPTRARALRAIFALLSPSAGAREAAVFKKGNALKPMRTLTGLALVSVLQLTLLAGCGSSHKGEPAAAAGPVTKKAVNSTDTTLARTFVAAVASIKPGTPPIPVQVKFALHEHPQPGQPADMDLALIATSGTLDSIVGKVHGEEGLTVVSGDEIPETQKPVEGVPITHTLQVLPKQDGIYELTVDVSVEAGGILSTQAYTIPLLAGKGMPDLPTTGTVTTPVAAGKPPAATPAH